MGGVPWSEVMCSLSSSALFFDHLPTSFSLTLVNPHWNCVCSALQASLPSPVSDPLSGTHFPSTFLEYLSRWNLSQWWCLWDKFSIKWCLRGLIPNTLANTWTSEITNLKSEKKRSACFSMHFGDYNSFVFWHLQSVRAASMPLSWVGKVVLLFRWRGSWQELRLLTRTTSVQV